MTVIKERTFLYAIGSEDGPVKIGITQNLLSRLRMLQTGSAQKLDLIFVCTFWDKRTAKTYETWFHKAYRLERLAGEWFDFNADIALCHLEHFAINFVGRDDYKTEAEAISLIRCDDAMDGAS